MEEVINGILIREVETTERSLMPVRRKFCGRFFSIILSLPGKNSGAAKSSIIWKPEWRGEVFAKIRENPQHQFLFLTKRPDLLDFDTDL